MESLKEKASKREKNATKWIVIGLCFLMVMFCLGFCSSPYSWYINYIVSYLDVPESLYSIGKSIRFVTTAVVNLFFGFLVAKFGTKKLILAGLASLSLSMLCHAFATNLVLIYFGGFLLGLGLAWTTTTIVGFIVNQWCKENKGTIMGAILAANGIGATIATLTIKPVIEKTATSFKQAYVIVAIIIAVLALCFLFFYKDKKVQVDDLPQKGEQKKAKRGSAWSGLEYKEVIKKPYFYLSLVCIFLTGMVLQSIVGIATPHLQNVGFTPAFVSVTIVIHSVTLTVFKFLTGVIYDKLGLRITTSLCMIAGVLVMIALALVSNSTVGMVLAIFYTAFSSLAMPLETIMLPIFANDLFGEKAYNKTLGLVVSVNTAGYALGAPLASLCRDLTGSYAVSLWLCAGIMAALLVLIQFVINASNKEKKAVLERESKTIEN